MTEAEFQADLSRAETMRRLATAPTVADFYTGYIRGLRRKYFGDEISPKRSMSYGWA